MHKPSCTFPPTQEKLAHSSPSCIRIPRKNSQNKTLSNISNKTKAKAKNHVCVPLDVSDTQHMENAPVEIPQRLHYPSLLAPSSHFNRVRNSERPLPTLIFTRAKTTSRVLRFSCMSAKLDQMDCSAKHENFFFLFFLFTYVK